MKGPANRSASKIQPYRNKRNPVFRALPAGWGHRIPCHVGMERGQEPAILLCPNNPSGINYKHFANDLKRGNLERVAAHGMFDANGRTSSLFAFTQISGALTERQHTFSNCWHLICIWHWCECCSMNGITSPVPWWKNTEKSSRTGRRKFCVMCQMGKSNLEIGSLLKISPLPLKTYSKILRKLNVNIGACGGQGDGIEDHALVIVWSCGKSLCSPTPYEKFIDYRFKVTSGL